MRHHTEFETLIAEAKGHGPLRTAIVAPVDAVSLGGAIRAAQAGLIAPVLYGPPSTIREVAAAEGIPIGGVPIVDAAEACAAAAAAVADAVRGDVAALMKGDLHTDELMHAVVSEPALRTGRRISHVFVAEIPRYPKLLLVTDAAINIAPTLEEKRDIVQNAIYLAHALGIRMPKVALLAAIETVSSHQPATLDAAALCKMADRDQIRGGVVDGPLAFDDAVSLHAAREKHILSPVAGEADVLVAPGIEVGNAIFKSLEYMGGARCAGIVMGARIPVILTGRADGDATRIASAALAASVSRAPASLR